MVAIWDEYGVLVAKVGKCNLWTVADVRFCYTKVHVEVDSQWTSAGSY